MRAFLGVDVGTGSVRAGLFDEAGALLATESSPIPIFHRDGGVVEQSSSAIWDAVVRSTKAARTAAGLQPEAIAGIGFDATCSMVLVGADDTPVAASPGGPDVQDVIVWMDHRAASEAAEINAGCWDVLSAVGGKISPEMQVPKLLWLSRHHRSAYDSAAGFFDLPDWLTYRATGATTRSLCSLTCKWTLNGAGQGWSAEFLDGIGLGDLLDNDAERIGSSAAAPGEAVGHLSQKAAAELGLTEGIPVASGMIDAYAGALGTLFAGAPSSGEGRLALIAGTSACHIVLTPELRRVPGVWGPYKDVLLPGPWALEAGQSAAGAFLDAVLSRRATLGGEAGTAASSVARLIEQARAAATGRLADLGRDVHLLPDILGNRSPVADPAARAAVVGFGADAGEADLAREIVAAIQALACGTRHIIDALGASGVDVRDIVVSGGLARNELYLSDTASVTGLPVLVPATAEPVLLGSAMLGRAAAEGAPLAAIASQMAGDVAKTVDPAPEDAGYFEKKYNVFRKLQEDEASYRAIMNGEEA